MSQDKYPESLRRHQTPPKKKQEPGFKRKLSQYFSNRDSLSNALDIIEHGKQAVHRERTTAIEWQGTTWDVWEEAAMSD